MGDKGTSKRHQGMKIPMGNTREMPKGPKQCKGNIEGYQKKNWFLFFQLMGGCQMSPKQFQWCRTKLRKIYETSKGI